MKIHLYTTFYNEKNVARKNELLQCIKNNVDNFAIASVTVFNEWEPLSYLAAGKIIDISIKKRPTYKDFITYINTHTDSHDIHIIANTDIFFNDHIAVLKQVMDTQTCFALARWDTTESDSPLLHNHNDSQDVWIFKGPVSNDLKADFPLGVPRCDNRFLYELQQAGYHVLNPSFSIKAFHIHKGQRALVYTEDDNIYKIPPPYRYKYPHNMFGFWKTLVFNATNKPKLGGYRYDIKKMNNWWVIRLNRKLLEILTRKKMPLIGYK